ncbi:MarR family winged helix-turn-helix transcriptional regulator [Phaeobacter gallaeciensis]|nr:MarR family transcriptional regulator [Phaeobacter gallaeciensis]
MINLGGIYCKVLACASILDVMCGMNDLRLTNTLRLMQSADQIKARLSGDFASVHGLSVNEVLLLMHLEQAPLCRMSRVELAKRMHLSASTVTRMAAPLEKLGLVSRQADSRDARLAFVVLTDAGLEKIKEARATFAKQASYVFRDRWSDTDLEELSSLLHRLIADAPGNLT